MKEVLFVFLFVVSVAIVGFVSQDVENPQFSTGNMMRRCVDTSECGPFMYCEDLRGGDNGADGRRGQHCRPKYVAGVACFEHFQCRSNYCNKAKADETGRGVCDTPLSG